MNAPVMASTGTEAVPTKKSCLLNRSCRDHVRTARIPETAAIGRWLERYVDRLTVRQLPVMGGGAIGRWSAAATT